MVDLEVDQGLAVITINRPEARNAIGPATMDELEKAIDAADGATALVITGAGDRAFVSGGDLKQLATLRTKAEAMDMAMRMRGICDQLASFPAPVIAALNGHAIGGGAEVAVAADIRLAAADIKIGFTQATLAIMPAWGGAERLAALVGRGRALLLATAGTLLDAAEAERLGLVDRVLPRATFEEDWRSLARTIADGPGRQIKHITTHEVPAEEAAGLFAELWVADEHWDAVERMTRRGN